MACKKTKPDDITTEALGLLYGDRQDAYGSFEESFGRIAQFWTTYLGVEIMPTDVAQMMLLLKISRQKHAHKRDNIIDQINYAVVTGHLNGEV